MTTAEYAESVDAKLNRLQDVVAILSFYHAAAVEQRNSVLEHRQQVERLLSAESQA